MKPLINLAELKTEFFGHGKSFEAQIASFGKQIGARQLGIRLVVVPPGKRGWPFHSHYANEEMFIILKGSGTLRYGAERFPVREGDVIATPAGSKETAHQIINTSEAELRYLALSTLHDPEICEYPDSGKYGAYAGFESKGRANADLVTMNRAGHGVDYWDGEAE